MPDDTLICMDGFFVTLPLETQAKLKSLASRPKAEPKPKSSPRGKKAKPDGDICDSQTEIAAKMMLHYRNADGTSKLKIKIKKGTICDWIAGKRLHGKPRPPEPIEGGRRRWSLSAWLAWFDANMWHRYRATAAEANGATPQQMPIEELEQAVERERLERERERIARERSIEKGHYVLAETSARTGAGLMIVASNAAREGFERKLLTKIGTGLDAFITDEALRQRFLEKLREDGIGLMTEWQAETAGRFREIIKQGTMPFAVKPSAT